MRPMPMPRVLCDLLAIWLQLPTRGFVFYRAVILLKAGIALLAWFLLTAVLVEARDRLPGPVSSGLPSHRVEPSSKWIVFGKLRAERLQVRLTDATPVHPKPNGFVANELRGADGFVNPGLLTLIDSQLVFLDEHADPVCGRLLGWQSPAWPSGKSHQPEPWLPRVVALLQLNEDWLNVSYDYCTVSYGAMSSKAVGPFIPGLKARGFLALFCIGASLS